MLSDILPERLYEHIKRFDISLLQEIRLRRNAPVFVNYNGTNRQLLTFEEKPVFANSSDLEYILRKSTENSLYAYSSEIKQGFITAKGGIRIGLAGESVLSDNFMPSTIKSINSMNIRIPHEVKDCSKIAYRFIANDNGIKNSLIVSPPGAGKTTFLRDIARKLSMENKNYNCLIVDERFELASCDNGTPLLDVGYKTDVVSGASKKYAFSNAIRVLRPDVIITDELCSKEDCNACLDAIKSGVKVIASVHARDYFDLLEREETKKLLETKLFERIVILSNEERVGQVKAIYDENLKCLYF